MYFRHSIYTFIFWTFAFLASAQSPPQLKQPINGAQDRPTTLMFSWSSVSSADTYQIQVAQDAGFSSTEFEDNTSSTSIEVSGLSNQTAYYWRVRSGTVLIGGVTSYGDWSEVWTFTTVIEAPVAPQPTNPDDGAENLETNVTFEWNTSERAESYRIQVSESQDFSSTTVDSSDITVSTLQISNLSYSSNYHWRVSATNAGGTSDWSDSYSFTTVTPPPNAPELASPADGSGNHSTEVSLEWNSADNADSYRVQVSKNQDFSSALIDSSGISGTVFQISNLTYDTSYFWRVSASNNGGTSDWSNTYSFTTISPPNAPDLASPADGSGNHSTVVSLEWNSADNADSYRVQVSEVSDFANTSTDQSELSQTSYKVSNLEKSTTYYWRVRASNQAGDGEWSDIWNFSTIDAAPPPPQLVSPQDKATDISTAPTLDWNRADRADTYDFQIATDSAFNTLVVNLSDVTSTEYAADLDGYTTYYWRVRAKNADGAGDWSEIWRFTTQSEGSSITISNPQSGMIWKAGQTYTVRWNTTNNINEVHLEYRLSDSSKVWHPIAKGLSASENRFDWTVPDSGSVDAQIRILDSQNSEISAVSPSFVIYPGSYSLVYEYSFNGGDDARQYQLIALPTGAEIGIEELFKGDKGSDWRLFHDNGKPKNYLVEHGEADQFKFRAGQGYWAISRENATISKRVETVSLEDDSVYSIPLQYGWNIIGNPFSITIPWSEVQEINGISSTLWTYESSYQEKTRMQAYKGYYFFNKDSLDHLKIPYATGGNTQQEKNSTYHPSSAKQLELGIRDRHNEHSFSQIQIGYQPVKNHSLSKQFKFAPPAPFQDYQITMKSPVPQHSGYLLSGQVLSRIEKMTKIDLQIKGIPGEQIQLVVERPSVFSAYALKLVETRTGKSWNLHQTETIPLNIEQEISDYHLLIGTTESVDQSVSRTLPGRATLSQNYPNPFNGQTIIEYSIPAQFGTVPVRLEVFNVLGRKIYTLIDKPQQPGFHSVRWNGEDSGNRALPSGVYFYRLQIGEKSFTKKLTLIE